MRASRDLIDLKTEAKIQKASEGLLAAVSQLQSTYPGKPFTLDGRLVGDSEEVVASLAYKLTQNEGLTKLPDAVCYEGEMFRSRPPLARA
ncbi:Uncharacterised protein [Pseudomonas putida]|jgi:hypothetical protein|uniref:DUF6998 domain-containing protein n=1 Tax=Pseudomonas putida (strain ATCC 47054 / DSM 6125 / CFBP 8728 / NCIMB 11950 / KT2440) TaxID=160488 RepID=A0A140FWR2_PSEPK|nr:protein of unknown function [Pseudomonas putida KT2440]VEE43482.1 Uncharacterised protein [Pseudomonas putida]VTQ30894.1 Uncharacterised protein [Pseudomonas putida]